MFLNCGGAVQRPFFHSFPLDKRMFAWYNIAVYHSESDRFRHSVFKDSKGTFS